MAKKFLAKRTLFLHPLPPDPELTYAGGWADFGGITTTGGTDGVLREFTNMETLLNAIVTSDESEPEIFRYIGPETFELDTTSYSVSTFSRPKQNKTLDSNLGQLLTRGEIRWEYANNIIVSNFKRKGPYELRSGANRDFLTLNNCTRVWVKNMEFNGEENWQPGDNTYIDGSIDANYSNYVTVSDCIFKGVARGILLGYDDSNTANRGLLKFTIKRNLFENVQQRAPRVRFGEVHVLNNLFRWNPVWGTGGLGRPSITYTIGVGREAQIYSQGNYFDNGDRLFSEYDSETIKLSGVKSDGDFIGSYNPSYDSVIRPTNVLWNPNTLDTYNFELLTASDARTYVLANAGTL